MPLPPEHSKLKSLLATLLEQLPIYAGVETAYDDAAWVGARLAEALPFTLVLKQSLLETRDPRARLDKIAAALARRIVARLTPRAPCYASHPRAGRRARRVNGK